MQKPIISFLKKILNLLIFIGLGVFFIWLSVKNLTDSDWEAIRKSFENVFKTHRWIWLIVGLIPGAMSHYIRALRSVLLMEATGCKIKKSLSFYAVMVGYLANLGFPRAGEVLRCTFLQRYCDVSFQKSIGTIINERVVDLLVFVFFLVIAIGLNGQALMNINITANESIGDFLTTKFSGLFFSHTIWIITFIGISGLALCFLFRKKIAKIAFFEKIIQFFRGLVKGLISITKLKNPFLFIGYSFLIWVFYFITTYISFFSFDFLDNSGFMEPYLCLVYGTIGFMIAQGGIGAYPIIVAGTLVLFNVDYAQGLAAGWLGWTMQTIMVIVLGLFSFIMGSFLKGKRSK